MGRNSLYRDVNATESPRIHLYVVLSKLPKIDTLFLVVASQILVLNNLSCLGRDDDATDASPHSGACHDRGLCKWCGVFTYWRVSRRQLVLYTCEARLLFLESGSSSISCTTVHLMGLHEPTHQTIRHTHCLHGTVRHCFSLSVTQVGRTATAQRAINGVETASDGEEESHDTRDDNGAVDSTADGDVDDDAPSSSSWPISGTVCRITLITRAYEFLRAIFFFANLEGRVVIVMKPPAETNRTTHIPTYTTGK